MELTTSAAEVEVLAGPAELAKVTVSDSSEKSVRLVPPAAAGGAGDWNTEVVARYDGHLRLQLPTGSKLSIRTASGDVQVTDLGGDIAISTASGDIHVRCAGRAAQQQQWRYGSARYQGAIEAKTTSGELRVGGEIVSALRFTSVSGDLTLTGPCRLAACQVTADTTSGRCS